MIRKKYRKFTCAYNTSISFSFFIFFFKCVVTNNFKSQILANLSISVRKRQSDLKNDDTVKAFKLPNSTLLLLIDNSFGGIKLIPNTLTLSLLCDCRCLRNASNKCS